MCEVSSSVTSAIGYTVGGVKFVVIVKRVLWKKHSLQFKSLITVGYRESNTNVKMKLITIHKESQNYLLFSNSFQQEKSIKLVQTKV